MNPKYLLVSAWWPECQHLAHWCGAEKSTPLAAGELVLCPQKEAVLVCSGIGALASAIAVSRCLEKFPEIEAVLFCGTAGHYCSEVSLGSVFYSQESFFSDAGVVLQKSYFPPNRSLFQKLESQKFSELKKQQQLLNTCEFEPLRAVKCMTLPAITESPELAILFSKIADLEHLEFHGVAAAANEFGKKWAGFFGVSNTVGPAAHEQWTRTHLEASFAAQKVLYAAIFGGG